MSIKSHAFGGVVLTDADAAKFKAQITHGRPKAAAKANVIAGVMLSRKLREERSLKLKLTK